MGLVGLAIQLLPVMFSCSCHGRLSHAVAWDACVYMRVTVSSRVFVYTHACVYVHARPCLSGGGHRQHSLTGKRKCYGKGAIKQKAVYSFGFKSFRTRLEMHVQALLHCCMHVVKLSRQYLGRVHRV